MGSYSTEGDQAMQRFHLTATGYNLNYLPEYIALRHGLFREQGLDVIVTIPKPWDGVLDDLADGTADLALGGIWVPSMYRDRVEDYTVFAQIANRSPLALLKRGPLEGFKLADVVGRTVLMKSGGGASVGLFFKMLLRENGIDASTADYVQDLDGTMLGNLFQGGMGDYFVTDNLSAQTMARRNPDVSVAMEMVSEGDIPWSVYYRKTTSLAPQVLDKQKRFFTAVGKGIDWVLQHDAESFRDELAELFPDVPIDVVLNVTNTFRREGMWTSVSIPREGFDRWQQGLSDARFVNEPLPYESIVDDTSTVAVQTSDRTDLAEALKGR
jgi:NitT/TauT family transport system substrate-binding protein